MLRAILILLSVASSAVHALPVTLDHALYSTSAFAEVGADSDGIDAADSPPTAVPLASHAALRGADPDVDEFANADALADSGFLGVSTEVQGIVHPAGAVAEAALEQTLDVPGAYVLSLDFESLLDLAGATGGASLSLVLSAGNRTLFDEMFNDTAFITRHFELASGELGVLHVGLVSTLDSVGDSAPAALYGFNLATVDVHLNAVPAPNALTLMAACLLPLVGRRKRAGR